MRGRLGVRRLGVTVYALRPLGVDTAYYFTPHQGKFLAEFEKAWTIISA